MYVPICNSLKINFICSLAEQFSTNFNIHVHVRTCTWYMYMHMYLFNGSNFMLQIVKINCQQIVRVSCICKIYMYMYMYIIQKLKHLSLPPSLSPSLCSLLLPLVSGSSVFGCYGVSMQLVLQMTSHCLLTCVFSSPEPVKWVWSHIGIVLFILYNSHLL